MFFHGICFWHHVEYVQYFQRSAQAKLRSPDLPILHREREGGGRRERHREEGRGIGRNTYANNTGCACVAPIPYMFIYGYMVH